jgi:RNA polymerase sigma-70 factor (ECF subfamily)
MQTTVLQDHPSQTAGYAFQTTHWSAVVRATEPEAADALENLCRSYWYPLYGYLRRRGYQPDAAKDLTQEFFARLLAKRLLAGVDPTKGKFRSWLLGVMNHFLAHEYRRGTAQKRGGGQACFSLDQDQAEERYQLEGVDAAISPEASFDRRWALSVLGHAATRLRQEYEGGDKAVLYETLKSFVSLDCDTPTYEETGRKLGLGTAAVKSAIHRLRQRYLELIRQEIARTVTGASEVNEEIRYLLRVIRGQ